MSTPDDATALLEDETAAFRPFEALNGLSDAQLERPISAAHDWSGRDLIAHLVGWLGDAIDVANELATQDTSPARDRSSKAFDARGDEINAEIQATWRELPLTEVRRRLVDVPVTLRSAVRSVPASSWDADPEHMRFIHVYTIEHYEEHAADLEAILEAAAE